MRFLEGPHPSLFFAVSSVLDVMRKKNLNSSTLLTHQTYKNNSLQYGCIWNKQEGSDDAKWCTTTRPSRTTTPRWHAAQTGNGSCMVTLPANRSRVGGQRGQRRICMHAGAVLYPSSSNKFLMLLQVSLRPIRHRNGINEEKKNWGES
jgi:hypothetical protein